MQKMQKYEKPTFNLPDFQGRYLKQGTSGTYGNESLPNIKGSGNPAVVYNNAGGADGIYLAGLSGAFSAQSTVSTIKYYNSPGTANKTAAIGFNFNASNSSSVYQNDAKVNPDNAEVLYCIKY